MALELGGGPVSHEWCEIQPLNTLFLLAGRLALPDNFLILIIDLKFLVGSGGSYKVNSPQKKRVFLNSLMLTLHLDARFTSHLLQAAQIKQGSDTKQVTTNYLHLRLFCRLVELKGIEGCFPLNC